MALLYLFIFILILIIKFTNKLPCLLQSLLLQPHFLWRALASQNAMIGRLVFAQESVYFCTSTDRLTVEISRSQDLFLKSLLACTATRYLVKNSERQKKSMSFVITIQALGLSPGRPHIMGLCFDGCPCC